MDIRCLQALAGCEPLHLYLYYLTHGEIRENEDGSSKSTGGRHLSQHELQPFPFIRHMEAQLLGPSLSLDYLIN